MTSEEIEKRLAHIREVVGDPEAAHSAEDQLYEDFIRYVASLEKLAKLSAKAKLVLKANEIKFPRFCA